jgi:hypothetical protein
MPQVCGKKEKETVNERQQRAMWALINRVKGLLIFYSEREVAIRLSKAGYQDNDIFFAVKAAKLLCEYEQGDNQCTK